MFKTITMAKLYLKQELYVEALDVINELLNNNESEELLFFKAEALEGLNENEESEKILFQLMENGYIEEHVSKLLEKIYTKIGKKVIKKENIPNEEIASVYDRIGDIENAIKYYEKKTDELKNILENKG